MSSWLLGGYVTGALVALVGTDDRWPTRLVVAVLWRLGPLALVAVLAVLLAAAAVLWPWLAALLLAVGGAWWLLG
jgi:hypothetical protein